MKAKKLQALKLPKLRLLHTVGGYYRVEIHGEDSLRDPPRNYAVMNIGMAWTALEALAQAQAWFAGLIDDTPKSQPSPEAAKEPEAPTCEQHGTMVADDEMGRSWHCAACPAAISFAAQKKVE